MTPRPRILLTNDDGIHADGLRAAAEALAEIADVVVVAPDREQSACGHSLTLNRPLRIDEVAGDGAQRREHPRIGDATLLEPAHHALALVGVAVLQRMDSSARSSAPTNPDCSSSAR